MYDAVMKMEQLLGVYERLIDDLAGYMKENGIDYTNDDSVHPAIMLYSEAGRIFPGSCGRERWKIFSAWKGNTT